MPHVHLHPQEMYLHREGTRAVSQDRRRTKGTTFFELCSPILFLCVLAHGYNVRRVPEEGLLSGEF